ncbi:CHASE3 domain-containing protein [Ramlibacter sp. MMS24-I3-19]|uniref:CHASE3 domain-containing protein n=1 Tax=Ramlibacter sp. MMS24-I3-19 TaxID=3416606 RepID=UPI003D0397A8
MLADAGPVAIAPAQVAPHLRARRAAEPSRPAMRALALPAALTVLQLASAWGLPRLAAGLLQADWRKQMRDPGPDPTRAGFISAAMVTVLLVAGIYWLSLQQDRAQRYVSHTHEVLAAIAGTRADLAEVQNRLRRFLVSGRTDDLQSYEAARRAVHADAERLDELTRDNPVQQRNIAEFGAAVEPRLSADAEAIAVRRDHGVEAAQAFLEESRVPQQSRQVQDVLQRMSIEESRLLAGRLDRQQRQLVAFWVAIGLVLAGLLTALAVLYWQQRRREAVEHQLLDSERRFRLMTDAVRDYAIVMLDAGGHVQTWNAGARQIKGYEADEIIGRHFSVFYTPEDRACGVPTTLVAAALRDGHVLHEGWRVRKDGSRFWAGVVLTPLKDEQGRLAGFTKITRDLTDSRKAQEVERSRELSARLIAAQEQERRHIARELHDETGQALTLIRMQLQQLLPAGDSGASAAAEGIRLVDGAIAHIRGLSLRLRPPMLDDLGLQDALAWLLEQQARAAGWRHRLDMPDLDERLPADLETACFRIVQEALTNAARSSGASEVRVSLSLDGSRLALEVRDDGSGFDVERYRSREERTRHFGLVSMAERAAMAGGHLEIDSAPGRGTCIRASFVVPAAQQAEQRDRDAATA